MPDYRISFFNRLTNSYGRSFDVPQRSIEVTCPEGCEKALDLAKRAFEKAEGVGNWRARASAIQCIELNEAPDSPAFPQLR